MGTKTWSRLEFGSVFSNVHIFRRPAMHKGIVIFSYILCFQHPIR
jgi:hypothetical protein